MIQFDEKTGIFHLSNAKMSYVLQVIRGRYLMHRYWGRKLRTFRDSRPFQELDRGFSPQPGAYENERTFSLDVLPQEYPGYGHVDYRIPAYEVRLADGTTTTELFYKGYEIMKGKPALAGLPAAYAADDEAETLKITLADSKGKLEAELSYTIFADADVIARSACLKNSGEEPMDLLNAASFALDLPDHDFDRMNLWGGHAAERTAERVPLMHGIEESASRRGSSSHQASPFLALLRKDAGEKSGEVYGFSLVWSGEFSLKTEVEQFGTTRVVGGINPFDRVDIDAENLAAILDIDKLFKAVGGRVLFRLRHCLGQILRRFGRDFGQHFLQLFHFLHAAPFGQTLAHALQRVGKAGFLDRLHQIVDGLRLERANGMVGIGRDEHEQRRFDFHQPLNDGKTVESGHLNVQEHKIGLVRLDRPDRFAAVHATVDDLDIFMCLKPQFQPLNRKGFVIDENGSDGHAASRVGSSSWNGISIRTLKPLPGIERVSNR